MIEVWHFTNGMWLRDGRPLVIGEMVHHEGSIKLCQSGFHGSKLLLDALCYAPGTQLSRCVLSGKIVYGDDKLVASERTALWTIDATDVLRRFAVWCAYGALLAEREAGREPDPRSWAALGPFENAAADARAAADAAADAAARAAAYYAAYAAAYAATRAAAADADAAAADAAHDAAAVSYAQETRLVEMVVEAHTMEGV